MNQSALLPVGTRVTHFDGGPSTHGQGTIVAYNGQREHAYLTERPIEAIEMANAVGLLAALAGGAYDGTRYPYVVQWDKNAHMPEYPNGYKDVYEGGSIRPVNDTALTV